MKVVTGLKKNRVQFADPSCACRLLGLPVVVHTHGGLQCLTSEEFL